MTVLVKAAAMLGVPPSETVFFRFAFGFVTFYLLRKTGAAPFKEVNRRALVWRGVFGAAAMMCYFQAIARGPVSVASILNNTYPIFVALFSHRFLGEQVGSKNFIALILSFVGVYWVIDPDWSSFEPASAYGIASGVLAAFAILKLRECRRTDSTSAILYYLHWIGLLFTAPLLALPGTVLPDLPQLGVLFLTFACSAAAQAMLTYGYRFVPAAEGSGITLAVPAFATVFSMALFGERIGWNVAAGGLLAIVSAAAMHLGNGALSRNAARPR